MTVILLTFWIDLYSHVKKNVFTAVFAAALWKAKYTQSTFKSNNIFFHKKTIFFLDLKCFLQVLTSSASQTVVEFCTTLLYNIT